MRTLWTILVAIAVGFVAQAQQQVNNFRVLTNLYVGNAITGLTLNGYNIDAIATNSAANKLDTTNGTAVNLTVDGAKPTLYVTNVAAMRALTNLQSGQLVQTAGRNVSGYGGATFVWTSGLTTTTNLGTVFDRDTGGTGRFTLAHGDPGDIRLWGAVPGAGDDAPAIQAAINTLTATTFGGATKPRIFIPSGQWHVSTSLLITNPIVFAGEGVELNSVNVSAYSLNGSVLVSTITGGDPVIKVVGTDTGSGITYIQGIEMRDFGVDGSTIDGPGIWFDCNSNASDIYLSRIIVRNVGGSAFKGGDGTKDGSPRYGYSTFEELTAIFPGLDGFEFYCEQMATVKMRFVGLYVNGASRHGFNFVNMGDFWAERWVENNAGQSQDGDGLHLRNVNNATFVDCYWEGDGRNQSSGGSYTPTYSAAAARLEGVSKCTFINCVLTSPSGNLSSPSTSGALELVSSTSSDGFSARDTSNNEFLNIRISGYTPIVAIPAATAAGSGGLLSAGVYRYRVAITYSGGWETPLSACGERVVTAVSGDSISLSSIATGSTLGTNTVTGRKIYRTSAGGSTFKLLTTIGDNTTTTFTDTTADAALGPNASFFWLIYADSASHLNRLSKLNVDVQPLVSDSGVRNTFNTIYVANQSPSTMPNIGAGAFNNTFSSGLNGTRHFSGADSSGMLTGYGLTAATPKRTSFVIPSYQSSRFAQSQATLIDGEITSTANTVSIGGGNSSDFAATEIALYAASGITTTTGTKQVSITSAGTAFQTAVTNLSTVGFGGASTFGAAVALNEHATLANNKFLYGRDSGGTARINIGRSASDIMQIGDGTSRINILAGGTGGLYLGQPGVTASIFVPRINTATAGNTTRNSQTFGYVGAYWNGSAEVQYEATTRLSLDSVAPTASLYWALGGVDQMRLKSDGTLYIGSAATKVATQPTTETLTASAGTLTITAGKGPNQSSRWVADGNVTLAWSSLADNDGGRLRVWPAATNVTVTLPNFASGPSGTTLTVSGGTGYTNYTEIVWINGVENSTNRVSVNALNYYR